MAIGNSAGNQLLFAPFGGVGEIGMNLAMYGLGDEKRRKWLIVDCGVSFAGEDDAGSVAQAKGSGLCDAVHGGAA
jgi:mRNA degradation ribonuclease J1/J2